MAFKNTLLFRLFPFILLFILAVLVRYQYWTVHPVLFASPDTYGYYIAGQRLITEGIITDDARPPFYSLILILPSFLKGRPETPILSADFFADMRIIILFQSFLGLLSLAVLYRILSILKFSRLVTCLFTLFTGLNIMIFSMERILMTETVTAFLILLYTLTFINLIKSWSYKKLTSLFFLLILIFLTKPIYILLPVFSFIIIILIFGKKKIIPASIPLLFFVLLVFLYSSLNYVRYGYYGFSRTIDFNLLGKILTQNLNIEPSRDNYYYPYLSRYVSAGKEPQPYRFMESVNPLYYLDKKKMNNLQPLVRSVITANFPVYLYKSLLEIPIAMVQPNLEVIEKPGSGSLAHIIVSFLKFFYEKALYITLLAIPSVFLISLSFIKQKNSDNSVWIIIAMIAFYQVFFTEMFGYGEFGRIISVAQPQIYLLVLGFLLKKFPLNIVRLPLDND